MALKIKRNYKKSVNAKVFLYQGLIGFCLIIFGILIGALVWYGTRLDFMQIKEVSVSETQTVDGGNLKQTVEQKLAGYYFGFIPKTFLWFYPEEDILATIEDEDRISNAEVFVADKILHIEIEEYVPEALWCRADDETHCVYLDRSGFAFAKAPPLRGGAFLRFYDSKRPLETGMSAFSQSFIDLSLAIHKAVYASLNFNIISIERIFNNEAIYRFAEGGEIKVSLNEPIQKTLENLAAILKSSDYKHLKSGNFEYIDLRYGNKIFILEDEVDTHLNSGTATTSEIN